ncbi:MAG: DNA gyrase inhibitor YacG [Gemmataceae bacterium]
MIVTRCPICEVSMRASSVASLPHLPFCSDRCRRIDLGRWLGESYRIPGSDTSDLPDDDTAPGLLPPTGP